MQASVAEGVEPGDFGSRSLRIGGASALCAAYKDAALARRWGRWNSDAFQDYLWDARDMAAGVACQVAAQDLAMVRGEGARRRRRRLRGLEAQGQPVGRPGLG